MLLTGLETIPKAVPHGSVVPARVIVYDQFDEADPFEFNLRINRGNKWSPAKCAKNSRAPLFTKRDLVPK